MRARDNPFATARVHRIRYRFDGTTWEELLSRLKSMNWRGAIVGPEGAGKTTLLEDFAPRLRERGFEVIRLRLTQEEPRFSCGLMRELSSQLSSSHIILFDGAELLSRWAWWDFLRRARRAWGLVITSHRPGLLPTLIECKTTLELLAGIVADLLNEAPEACRDRAGQLFRKHRGNLREALRELYDVYSVSATDSTEFPLPAARRPRDRTESVRLAG